MQNKPASKRAASEGGKNWAKKIEVKEECYAYISEQATTRDIPRTIVMDAIWLEIKGKTDLVEKRLDALYPQTTE